LKNDDTLDHILGDRQDESGDEILDPSNRPPDSEQNRYEIG